MPTPSTFLPPAPPLIDGVVNVRKYTTSGADDAGERNENPKHYGAVVVGASIVDGSISIPCPDGRSMI
jgi:hypothetical protein